MTEDELEPKGPSRATTIRRGIVLVLALACVGGWIFTRYVVKKGALGAACSFDMHCREEAPRCLKSTTEGEGVCSRSCLTNADCTEGITCVSVELEDRDERGIPLKGGYCFPQAILDARKKPKTAPVKSDSWIDVPAVDGQLEGEIVVERGDAKTTYEIKGSLLRLASKQTRTVVDTSTLRVYHVDDEKKQFSGSQIAAAPGEAKLTKTDRKDHVADRDCEIWQIELAGTSREACVVKGGAFVDPAAGAISAWERELAVRAAFPLRVVEGNKVKLLVTKLDARPLLATSFAIPKAYKNLATR